MATVYAVMSQAMTAYFCAYFVVCLSGSRGFLNQLNGLSLAAFLRYIAIAIVTRADRWHCNYHHHHHHHYRRLVLEGTSTSSKIVALLLQFVYGFSLSVIYPYCGISVSGRQVIAARKKT